MSFHILRNIIGFNFIFIFIIIITLSMGNTGRGLSTASMPADRAQANQRVGKVPKPIPAFLQDAPTRKHGKVLLRMASRQNRSEIKLHIQENSRPQDLTVYTDGSVRMELHC